jgi:hypothetical protein
MRWSRWSRAASRSGSRRGRLPRRGRISELRGEGRLAENGARPAGWQDSGPVRGRPVRGGPGGETTAGLCGAGRGEAGRVARAGRGEAGRGPAVGLGRASGGPRGPPRRADCDRRAGQGAACGRGGRGAQAGARERATARGRFGRGAQACARSGLTGGVEAAGGPCGGVAGVAPPAAPAAGEVACRDAAAFQNFGAREAVRKTGLVYSNRRVSAQ